MDKGEAIKELTLLGKYIDKNIRAIGSESIYMAIGAIRAQQKPTKLDRSRWEGCECCHDQRKICVNVGNYVYCEDFDCEGCQYFQSADYCRNCGKPLTEEAWMELERRISGGATD